MDFILAILVVANIALLFMLRRRPAAPAPVVPVRPVIRPVTEEKKKEASNIYAYVVDRGVNVALKVLKDPECVRIPVPAYMPGDVKWKYTSPKTSFIGWNVFLLQPKAGKHTWVVHSPSGESFMLPPEVCLEKGLDAAWFEDEERRNAVSERALNHEKQFMAESEGV